MHFSFWTHYNGIFWGSTSLHLADCGKITKHTSGARRTRSFRQKMDDAHMSQTFNMKILNKWDLMWFDLHPPGCLLVHTSWIVLSLRKQVKNHSNSSYDQNDNNNSKNDAKSKNCRSNWTKKTPNCQNSEFFSNLPFSKRIWRIFQGSLLFQTPRQDPCGHENFEAVIDQSDQLIWSTTSEDQSVYEEKYE